MHRSLHVCFFFTFQIYTREVAFDGGSEAYLSYRYLALVSQENFPANSPLVGGPSANGAKMISFSFVAQQSDGVLLTILSGVMIIAFYNFSMPVYPA